MKAIHDNIERKIFDMKLLNCFISIVKANILPDHTGQYSSESTLISTYACDQHYLLHYPQLNQYSSSVIINNTLQLHQHACNLTIYSMPCIIFHI